MNIGKKEKSYLLMAIAAVLVVGSIMYGRYLAGQKETLQAENATLDQEVAYLQDLMDHREEYEAETDRMNMEMEQIKDQFPAAVWPETQIMYANGLESKFDILTENLDMPGTEMVLVDAGMDYIAEDTSDSEESGGEESTEGSADAVESEVIASAATSISLYRAPISIDYQASYGGIKDVIEYINQDQDRKSIDTFSIGYDGQTGNLSGTIEMSMYALVGTGKEYQPPVVTGVTDGKSELIPGASTLNRSGANQAGDAATADGKSDSGTTTDTTTANAAQDNGD